MSEHWEPVIPYVYRRGALIERNSGDCGRWVDIDPYIDWVCEQCAKYYKQKYEVTQDGIVWTDSGIRRKGSIIDYDSRNCCIYRWVEMSITDTYWCDECEPPTGIKWSAYYDTGFASSAICDSSSALTRSEVPTSGSYLNHIISFTIGDCVTSIENTALSYTTLKKVNSGVEGVCVIPDNVVNVGNNAFENCSFSSVTIGSGVTNIGSNVFRGCPVEHAYFKSSTAFGCFRNYTSLTSTEFSDNVTSIEAGAVSGCTSLPEITIPDSVTSIGGWAFQNCTSLINASIGNGITSIEWMDFYNCASLTSVTMPNSVTSIGRWAFGNCSSLTGITIPNSVTRLIQGAFQNCVGATSLSIGSGVRTIEDSVFENCVRLTSITIPDNVTSVSYNAFKYCSGATSLSIGTGLTRIDAEVFYYCSSLSSVTIPSNIAYIGNRAFANCSSLNSITCLSTTPPTLPLDRYGGNYTFANTNECPIYVPSGSLETYKSASGWSLYASRIQSIT